MSSLPYENRAPMVDESRNFREWAALHRSPTPLRDQIKLRYRLLSQALESQELPAALRAAKQRQLNLEMQIELETRRY